MDFESLSHPREGAMETKNQRITRQVEEIIRKEGVIPCSVSSFEAAFKKAAHDNFLDGESWPTWSRSMKKEFRRRGLVEKTKKERSGTHIKQKNAQLQKQADRDSTFLVKSHPDP